MFGCLSFIPNSPSRRNRSMYGLSALVRLGVHPLRVAQAAAQHLHGEHLARCAVHGTVDAGERAGADAIQHFVVAVEEAGPRLAASSAVRADTASAARGATAPVETSPSGELVEPSSLHTLCSCAWSMTFTSSARWASCSAVLISAMARSYEMIRSCSISFTAELAANWHFVVGMSSLFRRSDYVVIRRCKSLPFSFRTLEALLGTRRVRGGWLRHRTSSISCRAAVG